MLGEPGVGDKHGSDSRRPPVAPTPRFERRCEQLEIPAYLALESRVNARYAHPAIEQPAHRAAH